MRKQPIVIDPSASQSQTIKLTGELVELYGLDKWAEEFSLMTAGYRDRLDPDDANNPDVPFNIVTVAILAQAKARVFKKKVAPGEVGQVHLGGETRPHTQTFIKIAAMVYAADGVKVHLRKTLQTTPIWYSSFGVFYEGYQSGDNFTASHSQYFKGGWKPMDGSGQQLLAEEAEIIAEVRAIVRNRETLQLGPWSPNPLITHDFDVDAAYVAFQNSAIGEKLIAGISEAGRSGFRCSICTVGGSMKATSERLFSRFGISTGSGGVVSYYFGEESSDYHKIGQVGDQNYGVDPSSRRIYRSVGAQQKLLSGETDIVFLWDPDGDRLNVVTKAPISIKDTALAAGLEVDEEQSNQECIVYFTPNQLYVILAAFRIDVLRAAGQLSGRDWFIGLTYPTTKSLEELAAIEGLRCVRVPVGFKYIGNLCQQIEASLTGGDVVFENSIGERISLGRTPRALILCEESGGATLGGSELLTDRSGERSMLALREKDAMQLGLLVLCLAARLHQPKVSFAKYYCDLVEKKGLKFIHYSRKDVRLYDEALMGDALKAAKEEGLRNRDKIMDFFGKLADDHKAGRLSLQGVQQAINDLTPPDVLRLPAITRACRAGNDLLHGMLFETAELRFLVRASGTDALMRYYVEGRDDASADALQNTLIAVQNKLID
jgi:phosphomannomutase